MNDPRSDRKVSTRQPKTKRVRLSYGELDVPERTTTKVLLRNGFLSKVEEMAPGVFGELAKQGLPTYSKLKSEYPAEYFEKDIQRLAVPPMSRERTSPIYDRHLTLIDLIERLESWAHKWNLVPCEPDDPWVLRVALANLQLWSIRGREGEYLPLGFDGFRIRRTPTPPDGLPPYNPLLQTREDYLTKVRLAVSEAMTSDPLLIHTGDRQIAAAARSAAAAAEAYCADAENEFKEAGMIQTGERRTLTQHLEWAVKFQIMGQTHAEIARETQLAETPDESTHRVEPQAVTKAVNIVLADIGLQSRLQFQSKQHESLPSSTPQLS